MSRKDDSFINTPPVKKLRFRGDLNLHHFDNRLEDIFDETTDKRKTKNTDTNDDQQNQQKEKRQQTRSFFDFIKIELTRGYVLEHDEERYSARRQKIYTFMKIPRELEKFMVYGVLQCTDSFLYIYTFLPIRYVLAIWAIMWRPIATCFGLRRRGQRFLAPAEICDLLKGSIWIVCALIMISVDTNRIYHIIKSQSVIKLYIFYNMLEVGDRLLSAFGQDTIDALFWTATEPKERSSRAHLGVISHTIFALFYIMLHSGLIMFQATTLNVAINSNNKGLLAIMMSNNFVELKGSVFKKFDKNNLFQLTCSDVRERIHLTVLLFVVVIQTMKEFNWRSDHFMVLLPDCCYVLLIEVLIDWIKHAFITRFNELPAEVYKEYTISLAYDMTQTRQKHAFSDHSDLVARRMGFIPFPLGVVLIKAIYTAIAFENVASIILFIIAFITLLTCRILNTICTLGKACDLMQKHQDEKQQLLTPTQQQYQQQPHSGATITNANNLNFANTAASSSSSSSLLTSMNLSNASLPSGIGLLPTTTTTTTPTSTKLHVSCVTNSMAGATTATSTPIISTTTTTTTTTTTNDQATSPMHLSFLPLQKSQTIDIVGTETKPSLSSSIGNINTCCRSNKMSSSHNNNNNNNNNNNVDNTIHLIGCRHHHRHDENLGATALFSNSDVDLDDICLNEQLLNKAPQMTMVDDIYEEQAHTRSVPDLKHQKTNSSYDSDDDLCTSLSRNNFGQSEHLIRRTHKRSESEPSIQSPLLEIGICGNSGGGGNNIGGGAFIGNNNERSS